LFFWSLFSKVINISIKINCHYRDTLLCLNLSQRFSWEAKKAVISLAYDILYTLIYTLYTLIYTLI